MPTTEVDKSLLYCTDVRHTDLWMVLIAIAIDSLLNQQWSLTSVQYLIHLVILILIQPWIRVIFALRYYYS